MGPGPIDSQIRHARAVGTAVGGAPAGVALDLGSGAGLPGLVLALVWPDSRWVLLDSRRRSVEFLAEGVSRLALGDRVRPVLERAEVVGRQPEHRGAYALVIARGFGPPAVTAACAAPLLAVGGHLAVSEPPGARGERWPEDGLALLGLRLREIRRTGEATVAILQQARQCPARFPRREGVPAKRPVFPNPEVDVSRETQPGT